MRFEEFKEAIENAEDDDFIMFELDNTKIIFDRVSYRQQGQVKEITLHFRKLK